eukprot:541186-Rhodomonas_salina.2
MKGTKLCRRRAFSFSYLTRRSSSSASACSPRSHVRAPSRHQPPQRMRPFAFSTVATHAPFHTVNRRNAYAPPHCQPSLKVHSYASPTVATHTLFHTASVAKHTPLRDTNSRNSYASSRQRLFRGRGGTSAASVPDFAWHVRSGKGARDLARAQRLLELCGGLLHDAVVLLPLLVSTAKSLEPRYEKTPRQYGRSTVPEIRGGSTGDALCQYKRGGRSIK